MGKTRIELIDMLRGFAAIAMIIGHSIIGYPINITSIAPFPVIHTVIYAFHMELFFVLAGVVWHYIDYRSLILSKAKRLLIPYGVFGVVTLIFHAVGGDAVHNQLGVLDGVKKMLFYGGNYWFLYTMFIICMIFPIIAHIEKKIRYFDLIVAGGVLLIQQFADITSVFTLSHVVYYLPYFILGNRVKKYVSEKETMPMGGHLVLGICLVAAIGYAAFPIEAVSTVKPLKYVCALGFIYPLYLLSMLLIKGAKKNHALSFLNKLFENCGVYSLQLYLFNPFILVVVRIILCNILHIGSPWIIVSTLVISNLAITLLLCLYVIPYVPILSAICGMKRKTVSK